jgi:spore cortex formation protein SpoVR/YcgB (stage V sporulation)
LAALRLNQSIGAEEEALIRSLREERNRIAHAEEEPAEEDVRAFVEAVSTLKEKLRRGDPACD